MTNLCNLFFEPYMSMLLRIVGWFGRFVGWFV